MNPYLRTKFKTPKLAIFYIREMLQENPWPELGNFEGFKKINTQIEDIGFTHEYPSVPFANGLMHIYLDEEYIGSLNVDKMLKSTAGVLGTPVIKYKEFSNLNISSTPWPWWLSSETFPYPIITKAYEEWNPPNPPPPILRAALGQQHHHSRYTPSKNLLGTRVDYGVFNNQAYFAIEGFPEIYTDPQTATNAVDEVWMLSFKEIWEQEMVREEEADPGYSSRSRVQKEEYQKAFPTHLEKLVSKHVNI